MIGMIVLMGSYLLCSVGGMTLFKLGMAASNFAREGRVFGMSLDLRSLLGLALYFCSFVLWTFILRKTELTYGIAILSGLSYLLVCVSGFVFFRESFTLFKALGIGAILIGVLLLNLK